MTTNQIYYHYITKRSDDLPAHFKSMVFGVILTIPLINGTLGLGSWQGIYLCEHRDHLEKYGEQRNLVITVNI
ncbi:YjbQ family protein [Psychrobacter fozii]|uniref:Uncharacterized protein UPF0047 n=1 Tax=Psychrobacter fozii TaxID=198480 RepID=A0A2V4VJR9_9GAMM|nr:YjbQ family protein [Psychrobacter fozii]PYE39015.1 uncharacterized protein UPF0047 [Psychrobacter fozii]